MSDTIVAADATKEGVQQSPTGIDDERMRKLKLLPLLYYDHIKRRQERKSERLKAKKRLRDAERMKVNRADKKAKKERKAADDVSRLITAKDERLRLLQSAVLRPKGDKRIQQLVGREEEIAAFWQASELALRQFGAKTSDAQIAGFYRRLTGNIAFNRHQSRSRRAIIRHLEKNGGPWS